MSRARFYARARGLCGVWCVWCCVRVGAALAANIVLAALPLWTWYIRHTQILTNQQLRECLIVALHCDGCCNGA